MKSIRALLFALAALVSAAASAQFGSPLNRANMIDWRTFKSGAISRINGEGLHVLNTEDDFQAYWSRSTGNPAETAPKGVDWHKYKLVAVHLGSRPNSGFSVFVKNVVRNGAYATLHVVEETPIPGQYVAQVVTSPWVIVQVERSAVDFRMQKESQQARPSIVLGPGGTYIGPKDNDGAGWVDPRYQCDWGTYRSGEESLIRVPQMLVLNTESDFQAYYERAFGERAPRGGVDWMRYRLVAIHLGERETTGYAVSVRNVMRNGVYGVIRAVEETPIPGQTVRRRPTQPFVIVRVERGLVQFSLDMSSQPAKRGIAIFGGG